MDKDKSAVQEFLGDLKGGDNLQETDPFANLNKEEQPEEKTEKKEEVLPFHKDPKIQKYIEKEISRKLSEYEVKEAPKGVEDEFKDVMECP